MLPCSRSLNSTWLLFYIFFWDGFLTPVLTPKTPRSLRPCLRSLYVRTGWLMRGAALAHPLTAASGSRQCHRAGRTCQYENTKVQPGNLNVCRHILTKLAKPTLWKLEKTILSEQYVWSLVCILTFWNFGGWEFFRTLKHPLATRGASRGSCVILLFRLSKFTEITTCSACHNTLTNNTVCRRTS